MSDPFDEIPRMRRAGAAGVLATIIAADGSTPAREAQHLLIRDDGRTFGTIGGGCAERQVVHAAAEVLHGETCRRMTFSLDNEEAAEDGMICGGSLEVFLEPLVFPTCGILGGGHLGKAVERIARAAGLRTVVLDDREDYACPERFPHAAEVICAPWTEVPGRIAFGSHAYLLIATRGHVHDADALEIALRTPARYVGMVGSRRKIGAIYDRLRERGLSESDFERVHAPVGLDIGARTVEEIALAVVAQMIAVRRGRPAGSAPPSGGGPTRPEAAPTPLPEEE